MRLNKDQDTANSGNSTRSDAAGNQHPNANVGYFRTVGATVNFLLEKLGRLRKVETQSLHAEMAACLSDMTNAYYDPRGPSIEYDKPLVRLGYLYRHVPINAHIIENAIRSSSHLRSFIRKRIADREGELRVCAFAGGPGTELLALTKYLLSEVDQCGHVNLQFTILDREEAWGETWDVLRNRIKEFMRARYGKDARRWPLSIEGTFRSIDVARTDSYVDLGLGLDHDLFVINYLMSELPPGESKRQFTGLVQQMAQSVSEPAWFLMADRSDLGTKMAVKRLVLNCRPSINLVESRAFDDNMDSDEQMSEMGRCYTALSALEASPRVRAKAFYATARTQGEVADSTPF